MKKPTAPFSLEDFCLKECPDGRGWGDADRKECRRTGPCVKASNLVQKAKAAKLTARLRRRYTAYSGVGDSRDVWLVIDREQFRIRSDETLRSARWWRDQLAAALTRMVEREGDATLQGSPEAQRKEIP